MVAAAVTAAAAAYSAYSASQNAKQQSAAMGAQQNAANANLALNEQYMHEQDQLYKPLMQQYVQEASGNTPLDYGINAGQIQSNYDAAQRNLQTQLAARGLSASGLAAGGATGMEIGRANALSSAFQSGLINRRNLGLQVLQHYNPQGAVQGVSNAYGNMQNMYGQYAGMYGQAAQQGYGAAASALGSVAQNYELGQADRQQAQINQESTGATADSSNPNSYLPYLDRAAPAGGLAPAAQVAPLPGYGADSLGYLGNNNFGSSSGVFGIPTLGYGQGVSLNTYGVNP